MQIIHKTTNQYQELSDIISKRRDTQEYKRRSHENQRIRNKIKKVKQDKKNFQETNKINKRNIQQKIQKHNHVLNTTHLKNNHTITINFYLLMLKQVSENLHVELLMACHKDLPWRHICFNLFIEPLIELLEEINCRLYADDLIIIGTNQDILIDTIEFLAVNNNNKIGPLALENLVSFQSYRINFRVEKVKPFKISQ